MANWNRWGVAAGLAGALAFFGPAQAQSPGTPNNMGTSNQGTTEPSTGTHGTRSGWSGSTATEPGERGSSGSAAAQQGETTGSTTAPSDTGSTASSAGSAKSHKVDKKLQEDVQKIHAANQAEVHMGQMGQQQASSPEVKQFAQKLEQDHQQLDEKLTQTAQTAGMTLEGKGYESQQKDAQKAMKKLQGKTGEEFDKEFVSMMVKDHEKDIKETQKAAKQARKDNQTELASLLDQAVAGMKSHLATAKELKNTVGKGKAARGSSSSSTGSGSSGSTETSGSSGSTTAPAAPGTAEPTNPKTGTGQ